jgi:hypothetical protein
MKMNRVQFQPGLSMPEFYEQYGTEAQCRAFGPSGVAPQPSRRRGLFAMKTLNRNAALVGKRFAEPSKEPTLDLVKCH